MQNLQDYPWRIGYSSNEHNPILDFYIPALERSVHYDRKSGFFSSAILSKVAQGLGVMLRNNGKIRLIMGCQFSPQDLEAIKQGYNLREALINRLNTELTPPQTFAQLKHFEILSWLIQHEYLDIKIAVPLKKNGIPESPTEQLDPHHIFHEKVGIFTDTVGHQLVCFGSNNESLGGWERNVESFHVYCSWEGQRDLERVNEEIFRFEQLWNNLAPNVKSFDIPEAVRQQLLRYTPATKPDWTTQTEFDVRPLPREKQMEVNQLHGEEIIPVTDENQELRENEQDLGNDGQEKNNDKRDAYGGLRLRAQPLTLTPEQLEQEHLAFAPLLSLPDSPGCLDFCLKSIPIQPWLHQIKILRRVAQTFPCNIKFA